MKSLLKIASETDYKKVIKVLDLMIAKGSSIIIDHERQAKTGYSIFKEGSQGIKGKWRLFIRSYLSKSIKFKKELIAPF